LPSKNLPHKTALADSAQTSLEAFASAKTLEMDVNCHFNNGHQQFQQCHLQDSSE